MPKLLWLFLIPFLTSLAILVLPSISRRNFKRLAVILSLLPLALLLPFGFEGWLGEKVQVQWLSSLAIEFYLRIDSLSLLFIYLTAIVIPVTLLALKSEKLSFPKTFYALVLLLQGLLIGFFAARDLVLFTIFWEAMLFPLYFIITIWGGSEKRRAAIKFLIYMIAGSSLMVAAVLGLYFSANTFKLDGLIGNAEQGPFAAWICAIFLLAFSVKTPLFPFHAWLPDAYYEAPTAGTVLLSALLSKAGIYGFLRIGLGLFPTFMQEWSPLFLGLSITGVLYGGMAAWMQSDFKRLIAYSSFSHVNFVVAGIFVWHQTAHEGAVLQAINHGITIAGLFIVAGWLEERLQSTSLSPFSGLAKYLPQLCWLTLIFVLSSVALPGTNNFVGELLILFGLFGVHPILTAVLGLTVILTVIYMLRLMQEVYFGPPSTFQHQWVDIGKKELLIALPLVALIFWLGIYPDPVLKQIDSVVETKSHLEAS